MPRSAQHKFYTSLHFIVALCCKRPYGGHVTGQDTAPRARWEALKTALTMRIGEDRGRWSEAGTVGENLCPERPEQDPDSDSACATLRVLGQKKFGLGALERSKANSQIQANESALDRLIVYSGPTLLGTQAGSKCLVEGLSAMPPPP